MLNVKCVPSPLFQWTPSCVPSCPWSPLLSYILSNAMVVAVLGSLVSRDLHARVYVCIVSETYGME